MFVLILVLSDFVMKFFDVLKDGISMVVVGEFFVIMLKFVVGVVVVIVGVF